MAEQEILREDGPVRRGPRVLSVGYLVGELRKRNQRLQEAGFAVDSASRPNDAFALAKANPYNCAVFGAAVPEPIRNGISAVVREKNPDAVIVMLYWTGIQNTELADAVLHVNTSDHDLQNILKHLLIMRSGAPAEERPTA